MKTEKIIYGVFAIIGIGLLVGAVIWAVATFHFQQRAQETAATITNIESYRNSKGERRHSVYVTYEVDGIVYRDRPLGSYTSSMYEGKVITIQYDPDDPGNITLKGLTWIGCGVMGGMGVIFALVGIIPICVMAKTARRKKRLTQNGLRLRAVVDIVELNYSYSVNKRHPYQILCHYEDTYQNVRYQFKSGNLWDSRISSLQEGDEIYVYVNPQDYSDYIVDTDNLQVGGMRVIDYT